MRPTNLMPKTPHLPHAQRLPFIKMHGLGNDFVITQRDELEKILRTQNGFKRKNDCVSDKALPPDFVKKIACRREGVGCDQLILLSPPSAPPGSLQNQADVRIEIYNPDGSEAEACGNASRCVAWQLGKILGKSHVTIETLSGFLICTLKDHEKGDVEVNMGKATCDWQDLSLKGPVAEALALTFDQAAPPLAVSIGNPHLVLFPTTMPSEEEIQQKGKELSTHTFFPHGINVIFALVDKDQQHIQIRVYERGTGPTNACGSGACATFAASYHQGLTGKAATVHQLGGALHIQLNEKNEALMCGPTSFVFQGELCLS